MNRVSTSKAPRIVVVGGSLSGLTLALASAHRGVPIHVVERAAERTQGGDSLSVDLAAIARTVGTDPRMYPILPVVPAYRDRHLTTWPALYNWLRDRALESPGVTLDGGKTVTSVRSQMQQAELLFADGTQMVADAVIGADGYHSIVRRAIAPDSPFAQYAGYLVWRGLVDEQDLSRPVRWPSTGGLRIQLVKGCRLVAAVLPGRDGSLEVGKRQVTFAWFDAYRNDLLRDMGRLTPEGHLVGTLGRGSIGAELREQLAAMVPKFWPKTWVEAVTVGVLSPNSLSGAPIAEYLPSKLADGPLGIIGDAAHVMSPMTGSGFATGVEDAATIARMFTELPPGEHVSHVLHHYQDARLPYVRAMVNHSRQLSAQYMQYAASFTTSQ